MLTLNDLLARVTAGNDNTPSERAEQRRVVIETLAAVGLLVNGRTGEVYAPANDSDERKAAR